jgi:hypothetical protein
MAREYAPDEPAAKQREFAPEPAAPKQDLYEKVSGQLREALPVEEGRQRVVGPMLAAGAGELARGVGAATQMIAPETGKKISDVGRAVVDVTKERYPITGTIGQFGSYIYPYKAAETAVTKVLPRKLTPEGRLALGREAQIAGAAGGITGAATAEGDLVDRAFGGALGTTLGIGGTYVGALASKGYDWTKSTLQKAFGGDAKRLSEALREYSSRLSGTEARTAEKMANDVEQEFAARSKKATGKVEKAKQTAGIAETAAQKAARQQEMAYRELPGTKTEKEAGRFKAVPTSEQSIGDRIRGYVDDVFDKLKTVRSKNAEKLKEESFGLAKAREQQGVMPKDTEAFKKGMAELDSMLNTATLADINAPLQRVRNALDPVKEVEGVIVGKPVTFEGLEQLRRFLRDRSYGLPSEGFDAIGQQQAGKLAEIVESIQREFTTGYPSLMAAVKGDKSSAFDRFLEQYRKDSEPLQVFRTKTGKLFEEQLPGVTGYAKVPSENIPSKVFKDRESYQGLIEAVGGNRAFAENEARKYFASEMEKLAGDPKKLENFIRDNRTMLNLTNARDMAESYIARASALAKRGVAAKARSEEELQRIKDIEAATKTEGAAARREADRLKDLSTEFGQLESQIKTARTPEEIARIHDAFATRLWRNNKISQSEYETMLQQSNNVLQKVADRNEAIRNLLSLSWKSVGGGLVGAGVYGGVRYFGNQ